MEDVALSEAFAKLVETVDRDDRFVGLLLGGSRGKGLGTERSDYDVYVVVADDVDPQAIQFDVDYRDGIDLVGVWPVSAFATYAVGDGNDWNRYNFAHLQPAVDKLGTLQNQTGSRQEGVGPICQRNEDDGQPFGDTLTDEVREVESHQSEAVRQYPWASDLFPGDPGQFPAGWVDIVHRQQRGVIERAGTTAERFDVDHRSHSLGPEQDVVQPKVAVHEVSGRQLDLPEGCEERVDGRDEPEPLGA
jgi:hypothetical protein